MSHLRRVAGVFDWRTFTVAVGFLVVLLVGFVIYTGAQSTHDANLAAIQSRKAASRRIDGLQAKVDALQRQLLAQVAQAKREQGASDAKLAAVAEQVRQLGGTPVATADPVTSRPRNTSKPTPSATRSPSPAPNHTTRPAPHPTPSPTCTRLPIVGTCRPF